MARVRLAGAAERLCPLDRGWAVAARWMRNLAIQLDEWGVINVSSETRFNGFQISAIAVACDLYAAR